MYERNKEDRAFKRYMAMYAEARNTPELTTSTWLTDALDNAYLKEAINSGMIERKDADKIQEQARAMRMLNEKKAKEFHELTEKLKEEKLIKEKGEN